MTSPAADRSTRPVIGEWVDGIDIPVVNERAVRASAGILFLLGFSAWLYGVITGDLQYMRGFGILFAAEMFLRLFVGPRFPPPLLLGALITRSSSPGGADSRWPFSGVCRSDGWGCRR